MFPRTFGFHSIGFIRNTNKEFRSTNLKKENKHELFYFLFRSKFGLWFNVYLLKASIRIISISWSINLKCYGFNEQWLHTHEDNVLFLEFLENPTKFSITYFNGKKHIFLGEEWKVTPMFRFIAIQFRINREWMNEIIWFRLFPSKRTTQNIPRFLCRFMNWYNSWMMACAINIVLRINTRKVAQ